MEIFHYPCSGSPLEKNDKFVYEVYNFFRSEHIYQYFYTRYTPTNSFIRHLLPLRKYVTIHMPLVSYNLHVARKGTTWL